MADLVIDSAVSANISRGMRSMVFTTNLIGYLFYIDGDNDFYYKKTTNGGATWGANVSISGTDTIQAFDVWYDQWTPGNTERCIHIWYFGSVATDDPTYQRLNTVNDTLLAAVTIVDLTSATSSRGVFISGAKMRGGNLLCCFDIDAGAEHGTYRSVDNGVTWTSRTDLVEATIDQALVFPGNETDPQDGWFLYHDASTDELTLKVHDDSANTNSESAAIATVVENITDATGQYAFSGAIRHSDSHLIAAFWTERSPVGATADFRIFDINGTGSLTELTALATNSTDSYHPTVFIDQKADIIYIGYSGKTDGSEALDVSTNLWYSYSKNRGISWTTDVQYTATTTSYRQTWSPLSGTMFMMMSRPTGDALNSNFDNKKEFGFTPLNNYKFPRAVGQNNTGIISVAGKG